MDAAGRPVRRSPAGIHSPHAECLVLFLLFACFGERQILRAHRPDRLTEVAAVGARAVIDRIEVDAPGAVRTAERTRPVVADGTSVVEIRNVAPPSSGQENGGSFITGFLTCYQITIRAIY